MTNRRRRAEPGPEEQATLQINATLPQLRRHVQLANGTIPDLANELIISEVEPIRRFAYGVAQLLEYWDWSLRSTHPLLIAIREKGETSSKIEGRMMRLCTSLGVKIWIWDAWREAWTLGGPVNMPQAPPTYPLVRLDATEWQPPHEATRAYRGTRQPYATWLKTYKARRPG